jgi:enterochelin esterase-like enzyme
VNLFPNFLTVFEIMQKFTSIIWLLLLIISFPGRGQSGKVFDELSMNSKILDGPRKYAVYLPPDYESSQRRYPVLYLLHGGGDDQTGWVQFGEVLHITDKAIREGKATPMIIIMPDANTGKRGYFNSMDGTWRYEDFFFEELMPYVEDKYRIKKDKRYRAVAGLSMGGGGSFIYALHRTDLFSSACPLSASIRTDTDDMKRYVERQGHDASDSELQAYYEKYSPLELVKSMPLDELKSVRWYIDCGDDDFLYKGNSLVHIAMRDRDIPHEYRVRDGEHTWSYWRSALPEVLAFISTAFHQR